jgi:murein DD-endopeptidase
MKWEQGCGRRIFRACTIIMLACSGSMRVGVAAAQTRQAFHMDILFPPHVVRFAEATTLMYELHLTNFAQTELLLNRLLIFDAESDSVIADLDRAALDTLTAKVSGLPSEPERRKFAPGQRGVVYLNVPTVTAPRKLRHRIEFDIVQGANVEDARAEGAETVVSASSAPILGPPLRGGPWVAVYDPGLERGHRRVIYAINGQARIPGRFAVDWMKVRAPRTSTSDLGTTQLRADGFGSEVLAVADAVVAATRDDFPDTDPAMSRKLEDATGNYISLQLGNGVYAFYEHLKRGILVKPGDRVRRGQVIARLGATGQANRPHLHFHLSTANSPLAAEGLPFALANVTELGAYESIEAFLNGDRWIPLRAPRTLQRPFFPSPNMVVMFPPGGGAK